MNRETALSKDYVNQSGVPSMDFANLAIEERHSSLLILTNWSSRTFSEIDIQGSL